MDNNAQVAVEHGVWKASRIGDIAELEMQVDGGADLNARQPGSGTTLLGETVIGNQPAVVT